MTKTELVETHVPMGRWLRAMALAVAKGAVVLGIAGCTMSATAQEAPERKAVTVGIGPDWSTSGHAVIAFHKGFFKEQGLDNVQLKSFAAGLLQVEAMASGAVDVANSGQGPILSVKSNGVPIVVLSSLTTLNDAIAIAVRRSAKVKEPKQLEGLKLGVLKGTSAEYMVSRLAKAYRVDASKIQLVNLAPPEQLASLATGAIDGIVVWQPWIQQAAKKVEIDIVHTGTKSLFASNPGERQRIDINRSVLASSERFVKANPRTVDALLRAYAKAQTFVADPKNYAEVVAIFSKQHNQDVQSNTEILKEYSTSLAMDDDYRADMVAMADALTESGRLRNKVSIADFTYGGPLQKIDPKLVSTEAKWKP
jgi:ABC-type nitrate/sulfonate/bicarbonate transport system substrate-binding protein